MTENAIITTTPTDLETQVRNGYADLRQLLESLAEENGRIVFDLTQSTGVKQCRSHIYRFRQINAELERRRKALKEDAVKFGRLVDGEAKDIKARIDEMIAVHQEPLDRMEREEEARKTRIADAIDAIAYAAVPTSYTSAGFSAAIDKLQAMELTPDVYQERFEEAKAKKADRLADLNAELNVARVREAEQEELAKLRREAAERETKDREERIAQEAAEQARLKAQRDLEQAQADAERKAKEAADREAQLKAQVEAAERRAAEAEHRAKEEAERKARQEAEAKAYAERAKQEREERITQVMKEVSQSLVEVMHRNDGRAYHLIADELAQAIAEGRIAHTAIVL